MSPRAAEPASRPRRRRKPRRRPLRRVALAALAALALALAAAGGWIAWAVQARPAGNPPQVEVQIPRGASGDRVVALLAAAGLAPRPRVTWWTLRATGAFDRVQAGVHTLPGDASALELSRLLVRPASARHVALTLIPGESVWQAARRIEEAGLAPAAEIVRLAADHALAADALGLPVGPPRAPRPDGVPPTYLEGFLYPDTYFFAPDEAPLDVLRRAARRHQEVWADLARRRATDLMAIRAAHGLDTLQLVTLASLVEEEAVRPEEAPTIAGVFYNRLARGMRLQTDPTLTYRPGRVGTPPTPADRRDATNPYNTYAYDGLPPGPISSPGRAALEAVVAPERHDYLYFVARREGRGAHAFARTLEEHRANVERFLKRPGARR